MKMKETIENIFIATIATATVVLAGGIAYILVNAFKFDFFH